MYTGANLTITKAKLTVKADDKQWYDDQAVPAQSFFTPAPLPVSKMAMSASTYLLVQQLILCPIIKWVSQASIILCLQALPAPANYSISSCEWYPVC